MIKTVSDFQPSPYQEAIFQAVKDGEKSLVISACPGSGKTTTIQQLIRYIPANANVLMVAFNKNAAIQLQSKVDAISNTMRYEGTKHPLVECRTIHSLGNKTIGYAGIRGQTQNYKYSRIVREYLRSKGIFDNTGELKDLCDFVRLTLLHINNDAVEDALQDFHNRLQDLCDQYDIEFDKEHKQACFNAVPKILQVGIDQARAGIIDFTDMIWLPSVLELRPPRFDYVLVDEAQDLNPAQRELILKAVRKNGHFVAVGDVNQAIYGFAGASLESIQEIIEATDARVLPLSICYRCPQSIVRKASSIHPGILAAPNMPDGKIISIPDEDIVDLVRPGDLIISRCNAPLVKICFELLQDGKRATIRGRDLGKSLGRAVETIQKFCKQNKTSLMPHLHSLDIIDLPEAVQEFLSRQLATLQGEEHAMKRMNLQDKFDTLLCLHQHYSRKHEHKSLGGFQEYIVSFFEEDENAQIILATGHRAKGLEYPRVFIISSNEQPHPLAKTPESITQEKNLMYVMYTRVLYKANIPESGMLFLGISSNYRMLVQEV